MKNSRDTIQKWISSKGRVPFCAEGMSGPYCTLIGGVLDCDHHHILYINELLAFLCVREECLPRD